MRKATTTKKAEKAATKKENKLVKLARIAKELSEMPITADDHLSISKGNLKMGPIPSISFPSGFTCDPGVPCWFDCYASNKENQYNETIQAYWRNYRIYKQDNARFWRELESAIMLSRFFRSGVSGDFPDMDYFKGLVNLAAKYPHCQILAFTKRYTFVNMFVANGGEIPANLHIIFSAWPGYKMVNPYHFPESHVLFNDGTTTASDGAKWCGGCCADCAKTGCGCWTLGCGEQVLFKEHR